MSLTHFVHAEQKKKTKKGKKKERIIYSVFFLTLKCVKEKRKKQHTHSHPLNIHKHLQNTL